MSVKCDLYAVRCPFYFFQMSVYVCVPRPKDANYSEQYKESKALFVNR